MNLENKRQVATILLAIGLGFVATILTGQVIKNSVTSQTQAYKKEFENKTVKPLLNELELSKREIKKIINNQQALAKQIEEAKRIRASAIPRSAAEVAVKTSEGVEIFSIRTPKGKRAVTIMIDALSAVGGLINPGDLVDIIAKLKIPADASLSGSKDDVTTVLFHNIQILAIGANFSPSGSKLNYETQQKSRSLNVTLAVTPEEASLLTFAQSNGKLQFSLRSPIEGKTENLQVASWDALSDYVMGKQGTTLLVPEKKEIKKTRKKAPKDEGPIKPDIEIYRGGLEL